MKTITKITLLDDNNEKFFGEGPLRLLHLIDEYGSLRSAASVMDMSYSKAFAIIKNAEKALQFRITERKIGGKSGGGSVLTYEAREWMMRYEEYRNACIRQNEELYSRYFSSVRTGAVIMASGCGKRFGGNKLMADFNGKPLIGSVLDTIAGLFDYSVVVTRNADTKKYAEKRDIKTVLHELPGRNDTVRIGISEMPARISGCIFFQADQPLITRKTVRGLLADISEHPELIIRCSSQGIPSAPVYFPKWAFSELCDLPQGKGGSYLFSKYPDKIMDHLISDSFELMDIDTPEDLNTARKF